MSALGQLRTVPDVFYRLSELDTTTGVFWKAIVLWQRGLVVTPWDNGQRYVVFHEQCFLCQRFAAVCGKAGVLATRMPCDGPPASFPHGVCDVCDSDVEDIGWFAMSVLWTDKRSPSQLTDMTNGIVVERAAIQAEIDRLTGTKGGGK